MKGNPTTTLTRATGGGRFNRDRSSISYPPSLERLQPLLGSQQELFRFSFDWDKWNEDRERYLLDLGVAPDAVHLALHDESYAGYVGVGSNE